MGTFVISKPLNGDYKFSFAARKGKTVFTSIGYKQKTDCELLIEALKKDAARLSFTKARNAAGKYFFRVAKDGLVLANSRKYTTELLLAKGIDQVHKYISTAEVLDFSEGGFEFPKGAVSDPLSVVSANENEV